MRSYGGPLTKSTLMIEQVATIPTGSGTVHSAFITQKIIITDKTESKTYTSLKCTIQTIPQP